MNRLHIDTLADLLPEQDEVTLVADCKLFDAQTVGELLLQRFHFISLVPKNFNIRDELVEVVRADADPMPALTQDANRQYRGRSFVRTFQAGVPDGPEGGNQKRPVELRYLVVKSEGHTGFRWLKNIALVTPVFLQMPQRIAALGVVLVLALMVRNYIQFAMDGQEAAHSATAVRGAATS